MVILFLVIASMASEPDVVVDSNHSNLHDHRSDERSSHRPSVKSRAPLRVYKKHNPEGNVGNPDDRDNCAFEVLNINLDINTLKRELLGRPGITSVSTIESGDLLVIARTHSHAADAFQELIHQARTNGKKFSYQVQWRRPKVLEMEEPVERPLKRPRYAEGERGYARIAPLTINLQMGAAITPLTHVLDSIASSMSFISYFNYDTSVGTVQLRLKDDGHTRVAYDILCASAHLRECIIGLE